MSKPTCNGCRWFMRYTSQEIGECRRYPLQHPQTQMLWPMVNQSAWCGEYTDNNDIAKETKRRDLVRQFALAIVASDTNGNMSIGRVWQMAAEFADYEGQT